MFSEDFAFKCSGVGPTVFRSEERPLSDPELRAEIARLVVDVERLKAENAGLAVDLCESRAEASTLRNLNEWLGAEAERLREATDVSGQLIACRGAALRALGAEVELRQLNEGLVERVAGQSEILSRRAEGR